MRRLLKARELGLPEGDLSTVERPGRTVRSVSATTEELCLELHGRAAARDAADPPLRGEVRRAVQRREDPRLPAPLHRRGGGRGRRRRRPLDGRRRRRHLPRARPRAGARRADGAIMAEMFGKVDGLQPAAAAARCTSSTRATPLLRRQRDRRRRPAASRSAWRWPTSCAGAGASPPASSATAPSPRASSTRALNLAALWQLPVLFCCENNLYAMGTALELARAQTDLAAEGRGATAWPPGPVDGMDVARRARRPPERARRATCGPAAGRASSSCGPTASAPTRCTTPSATGTRTRSTRGSERDPIDAARGTARRRRRPLTTPTWHAHARPTSTPRSTAAVAVAEAAPLGAGRGPDPVRLRGAGRPAGGRRQARDHATARRMPRPAIREAHARRDDRGSS